MLVVSWFAYEKYEGTIGPFLMFDASYLLLVLLAIPRPRLYVYTFLAIFLFLGFWLKFMVHSIVIYDFVEPVGRFSGSGETWDRTLLVSAVAALGVCVVRGIHLVYTRYISARPSDVAYVSDAPGWYAWFRKPLWVVTLLAVLGLNGWNVVAGFYQTGVSPRVILPLHLNLVASWLINVGFALWIATLAHWEAELRRGAPGRVLLAPIFEGLVATTSQLSRAIYLFHTLPYLLALIERGLKIKTRYPKGVIAAVSALFLVGFFISVVAVSLVRIQIYPVVVEATPTSAVSPSVPGAAVNQGATNSNVPERTTQSFDSLDSDTRKIIVESTVKQVLGLAVDRWIGLGGVLAVASQPGLGQDLFIDGLREDPGVGERAMFQEISGSGAIYAESEQFTFLTIPGSVAVLYYSGSLYVVGFGMAAVTLLLMGVELTFSRLIGNPLLSSVSGLVMANTVCQLNFPYLAGTFLMQLLVALVFLWAIQTASGSKKLRAAFSSVWSRSPT